ncbi:uncharacterized protein LOC122870150 [Siniperca chuatsi]|uniref:uncharacterized protein LOC122870150 n=1 Tax=Siniperca chuatsi TaxID=119488 RepID=UPI001CE14400|nr:uncharacterized protein LOC122870150 [Siniperca chuatsi]
MKFRHKAARSPSNTEKMTCSILLLITLTSCVCGSFPPAAGTFVVNVTQSSYQAEENEDITLEWTFTTKPDSSNSLNILCELITDHKASVLYHLYEGVEVPESQDGQFAGRVQCDRDVLREGRLRLHVSRLRTGDSGLYLCEVSTTYGGSIGKSRLNVTDVFGLFTAARDRPEPERPNTESRGMIVLYCGLGLTAAAAVLGVCYCLFSHSQPGEQSPPSQSPVMDLSKVADQQMDQRKQFDQQCKRDKTVRIQLYTTDTENTSFPLAGREKMTCSILLLITLTSCVCGSFPPAGYYPEREKTKYSFSLTNRAGTFVVNVTQSSYQAEENEDITLEWTFTTKPDSSNSLNIHCALITNHKVSVLYHLYEGVEVPDSQDGQFAGRVQCDRDVLREGRLRLHVSRLRTEDSGLYLCDVRTTYGGSFGKSRLNVTASDRPEAGTQKPTSQGATTCHCRLGRR